MVVGFGFFVWVCCIYIYIMDIKRKFIIVALVYGGMGAWGHGGMGKIYNKSRKSKTLLRDDERSLTFIRVFGFTPLVRLTCASSR
jgi:hypothetical protein